MKMTFKRHHIMLGGKDIFVICFLIRTKVSEI